MSNELPTRSRFRVPKRQAVRLRRFGALGQRRAAAIVGAVALGLVALLFARNADQMQDLFKNLLAWAPKAPWVLTPLAFAAIVYLTRRFAPESRGSGIPQVMEAARRPNAEDHTPLTSLRTAGFKYVLTLAMLAVGGSVGREGPTVQISAAVMKTAHKWFGVKASSAVLIAGGAAGISAAFNTPLAGVAFAIEELAAAYEQRMAMLALGAVMVSGLVSLGIAGDYVYFGSVHTLLSGKAAFAVCPLAGALGGALGGVFARAMLGLGSSRFAPLVWARRHPVLWAAICGLAVATVGYATNGATWGAGYAAAKSVIADGAELPWHYGFDKLFVTLASSASGAPGGIFAPSLSAGAGFGALLARLFPSEPVGAIATLGMIGYFVGVVRSPLTAVLIVSEMTDTRAMLIPLVATAIIADAASALVCKERLYHGLSKAFRVPEAQRALAELSEPSGQKNHPQTKPSSGV